MSRFNACAVSVLAALAMSGCVTGATPGSGDATLQGEWGGPRAGLVLSDSGGELEMDCAHGAFTGPLRIAADGSFVINGTFVRERGGPVRRDAPDTAVSATYAGKVVKATMMLRVSVGDATVGEFVLVRGQPQQIMKCR